MKVAIVGKFPPIEGGVSAQTFWLARSLARHGHGVHVVTNASSVEPSFRQLLYGRDEEVMRGVGDGAGIDLRMTTPLARHSYIPYAPPYVTQLFGLARAVIEQQRCDAVVGWYYEPYGFVAALVGHTTGIPVFLRHAGSDLARLSANPDLHRAYRWALSSATALVVTNEREFERRYGGVERPRLRLRRPGLPDAFSPHGERLDLAEVVPRAEEWFGLHGLADDVVVGIRRINSAKPFDEGRITIGAYGKVGETKGSYCLVDALARLADTGISFNFVALAGGTRSALDRYYRTILGNPTLAERSWVLPPLAPWRVPSFLRRCHIVCFLEHSFPIAFHGPVVPREVLASGACLVTSKEVANKPEYRQAIVDRRNAVVIADPQDREGLASRIQELILDPGLAWALGHQGERLSRFWAEDSRGLNDVAQDLVEQVRAATVNQAEGAQAACVARPGAV